MDQPSDLSLTVSKAVVTPQERNPIAISGVMLAIGLPLMAGGATLGVVEIWVGVGTVEPRVGLIAAAFAAICAVFAGIPAAHWAASRGVRRLVQWMGLGAAAGLLPTLMILCAGVAGLVLRGRFSALAMGPTALISYLTRAVGVPDILLRGSALAGLVVLPVFIGSLTAGVFWLSAIRGRARSQMRQ
jgi:hypothetical protein